MVEVINTSEDANASHLGQSNTSQLVLERSESPESCDLRECYTSESGYPLAPLAFTLPCEALSTTDANTKKTERLRKSPIQSSRWFSSLDHPGLRTDFNKLIVKWWIWELLGCFGSLLSFFAIVGVLMYYDGRGQPEWPYNITINSVLSWLTTAMKAFLLFSVAACIGQANWLHFRARPHALVDLIAYDSASRGPFGSVQLLWRLRAKHIASLGAIITILAIGVDPTVQQTIAILNSPRNSTAIAMLGRAQSFVQFTDFSVPKSEIVGAVLISTYFDSMDSDTSNRASLDVNPTCLTGNCTFPPFHSLAVCSSCENITAALNVTCYDTTLPRSEDPELLYCHSSLPNGLKVNITWLNDGRGAAASSGYLAPVGRPKYGNSLLNFSIINGPPPDYSPGSLHNISATQCFLYWCVNQYKSRVENGRLHEEIIGSWHSNTTRWIEGSGKGDSTQHLELLPPGLDESSSASNYIVEFFATHALSTWLVENLSFSSSYATSVRTGLLMASPDVSYNISSVAISRPFLESDLKSVFSHIAKGITSTVRSYNSSQQSYLDEEVMISGVGPANGTTHYNEIYVSVHWSWLAFSGALVVLTIIHLILTMIDTARHDMRVWKLSPIALLFHGLDVSELDQLSKTSELARMEALASQIDVQLRDSGDGFKLMR